LHAGCLRVAERGPLVAGFLRVMRQARVVRLARRRRRERRQDRTV
jgi:hypothetical protein